MCRVNMLTEFFKVYCEKQNLIKIYEIRTVFENNETYFCLRDIFNTFDVPQYNFSSYMKKIIDVVINAKAKNFREKGGYKIQFCNLVALKELLQIVPRFHDTERIACWADRVNKYYKEQGFNPATTSIGVTWYDKELEPCGYAKLIQDKEELVEQIEEWKKLCEELNNDRKILSAQIEIKNNEIKQIQEENENLKGELLNTRISRDQAIAETKEEESDITEVFISRQFSIMGKKSTEYLHEMVHLQKEIIDTLLDERENLKKQILGE